MSTPFVPIYRQFPAGDAHNLEKQLVNQSVQFGTAINNRTVSTFQLHVDGDSQMLPNGERWFPTAAQSTTPQRLRDGFRLVVQVADPPNGVLSVNHNIQLINQQTRLYGSFFDGTLWQTLPYIDVALITSQIKLSVSSTQIIVTKGATAPSINSGIVVFEFL